MSELRDFTGKNRKFTGTAGERISLGSTGERVNTQGTIRFNTTTNLMEYYDGNDWKSIDAPPVISGFTVDDVGGSSVTSATIDNEKSADGGLLTIEVLGSLFDVTGAGIEFIATAGNGETINTQSITRNSANKLTVTVTASEFDVANSPYTIRVTNGSGLSANLEACITADTDAPTFTNAADTNYDVFNGNRSSGTITAAELIEASPVVASSSAYAVTTGSLPTGFTLNSTSGDITWSGVSEVGVDTQTLFTITATSSEGGTATRQFGITVKAPVVTTFTSPGTFSATAGASYSFLVIAGGGGGGKGNGDQDTGKGGGGAGGFVEGTFTMPASPASIPITVGNGGAGFTTTSNGNGGIGNAGQNSVLTWPSVTVTAFGGGGGGASDNNGPTGNNNGGSGGSGGGGGARPSPGSGGASTQTSGTGYTGYGNSGGAASSAPNNGGGGGGGGAGGAGQAGQSPGTGGNGGAGRASNISGSSVTYAGGGGGGNNVNSSGETRSSGGSGGGGRGTVGKNTNYTPITSDINATPNTGSGGGGSADGEGGSNPIYWPGASSGAGGSGIIIIKD